MKKNKKSKGNKPMSNAKKKDYSITKYFGDNLAQLLSDKILTVYKQFNATAYIQEIKSQCKQLGYTERINLHAAKLFNYLPEDYNDAISILLQILGEENKNETGMFKEYYWIMPIGKYIEAYGLEYFKISVKAIEEITKRNTGEFAIRPFIRTYPEKTIRQLAKWAKSKNFHLRRLASEGSRPKLPWATKLETFIQNPEPVFAILELLKEDSIKFVQKSVANNIADYLKVNKEPAVQLLHKWKKSENKYTQWIIKHATRKIKIFST